MGIKGLSKLLADNAGSCLRERDIKSYFGRKVAVDASMSLYQFLIAVRATGSDGYMGQLTNEAGEVTSHISGMFYRTLRLLDNGIKPAYVFDGKPPVLKGGELEKRREKREKAAKDLIEAKETDDKEEIDKYERRLVRVTKEHCEDVKTLLRLMGIPVVEAPGEAEAQCAELCKGGLVFATATEDMDALTFGTPVLVRHMMTSAARKEPIHEYNLSTALSELGIDMDQFRDICILCGCDYTGSIRGIGQHRALDLVRKHKNIETIIKKVDSKKYVVPDQFLYKEARGLFITPLVTSASDLNLEWTTPDEEGIIKFMCDEKGFSEDRIKSGIARLNKSRGKGTQTRLESFFGAPKLVKRKKKPLKGKKSKKSKKKRR